MEDWRERALCIKTEEPLWFPTFLDEAGIDIPDDGQINTIVGDTTPYYAEARAICARCPVKEACLAHALAERERYGMWGGLTPLERLRIERRDRRARRKKRLALEADAERRSSI